MKWERWHSQMLDQDSVSALAKATGCSLLLASILWSRGFREKEAVLAHLETDMSQIHDPFLLAGMDQAVTRLKEAIAQGETVAIYGDYDVDGITATTLLHHYLTSCGLSPIAYIPDRMGEGYGLNVDALLSLKNKGVSLVVTVDCGVSAIEEVSYAKEMGLDIIITDHHTCDTILPDAISVVCPKRQDCTYPNPSLAGVGVAFKLVCAMEGIDKTEKLLALYGDLVAVGTISDVMPLLGENRMFVWAGLTALKKDTRHGFLALLTMGKMDLPRLTAMNISFGLAPKINAAGRMGDALLAFSLLCAKDGEQAKTLAKQLFELNEKRIVTEGKIMEEALAMIEEGADVTAPLVLAGENWHKGVLGVIAARIAERFRVPAIILSIEGNTVSGSCRSVGDFDLFAALTETAHLLDSFGGHKEAAGVHLDISNVNAFGNALVAIYQEQMTQGKQSPYGADFVVDSPKLLSVDQLRSIARLEPCGTENPSPTLIMEGTTLLKAQGIGDNKHLKLQVEKWGVLYDCVFFGVSPDSLGIEEGERLDLLFTPSLNYFRGKTTVQLVIKDIKHAMRRGKARVDSLQKAVEEGKDLDPNEASRFLPKREEFARVWRQLKGAAGKENEKVDFALFCERNPEICPGISYVCIHVFAQVQLLEMTEHGEDTLHIFIKENSPQVNLDDAVLLQTLKKQVEKGA